VTLRWIGVVAIFGTLALLAAAYFLLGRLRISAGRSGRKVPRFTGFERFSHWLTAVSFVILGLTGLNVTFGKLLLRPLIGPEAFSTFFRRRQVRAQLHSFSFVVGLALIIGCGSRTTSRDRTDVQWFRQGGDSSSRGTRPRAASMPRKAGVLGGAWRRTLVAISGFLLLFPFYVTNIFGCRSHKVCTP